MIIVQINPRSIYSVMSHRLFAVYHTVRRSYVTKLGGGFSEEESIKGFRLEFIL